MTMVRDETETFDFPKGNGSDIELAVIVPSTRKKDIRINDQAFEKRVEETKEKLSELFGGSNSVRGVGRYKSNDKGTIEEDVAVVETFTTTDRYKEVDQDLKDWLMTKKHNWGQESMGFEYEGDMYYV